ncbi:MAG: helix-turn-helix transcriptional regulator [Oscillospiraceae bacterium]|nr:helix-turn-helix transcriptional regulator [Oscillospiraceae bacterium]
MNREEALDFLDRLAKGISEMFGSACETLVHDLEIPTHPILIIYNGQVSGRSVGSTQDILGTNRSFDVSENWDMVNLLATTPSGQQIKSSTFCVKGDGYCFGFGINFDFSALTFANRILVDLMSADADLRSVLWREGEGTLEGIFEECVASIGKPVSAFGKRDRMKVVALLDKKNAFSFRKSVPYVAGRLDVSRYTVYKYLGELERNVKDAQE